jgi:tRNA pseudouridine38-40 synthase
MSGDNAVQEPMQPVRNVLLRLSYDGTDFFGWQIQPQRPTIQGVLTEAIFQITGESVHVHGAGRTDAGVHACGQAANVPLVCRIPCENLVKALNDRLPESIRVLSAQEVPPEFHARRAASSKTYRYRIFRGRICPPLLCRYVYPFPAPLQEEAMQAAAREFEGTRNFRSLASHDESDRRPGKSFVRSIYSSVLERAGEELVYTVVGNGFLHHMVRNIVGTLLALGRGQIVRGSIPLILAASDRSAAGPTVPARGLHLVCVEYPPFGPQANSARRQPCSDSLR